MKYILFLFHDETFHLHLNVFHHHLNALRPIQIDNRHKMSLGKFKSATRIYRIHVPKKAMNINFYLLKHSNPAFRLQSPACLQGSNSDTRYVLKLKVNGKISHYA